MSPVLLKVAALDSARHATFALQRGQFPVAFYPSEFLLRFQQPVSGPTRRLVAGVPAFDVARHAFHRGKAGLDGIGGGQASAQQLAHAQPDAP